MERDTSYTHTSDHHRDTVHEKVILEHLKDELSGVVDYCELHEKHEHSNPAVAEQFAEMARDEFSHAYMLKQSLCHLKLWHEVPQDILESWEKVCTLMGFSTNL